MKLTKQDINQVAKEYNLGKVKSVKPILHGWVNFSFDLRTSNGRFVLQVLTSKMNSWKRDKLELELALLEYLNRVDFPYLIPAPMKSSKGKYMGKIKAKPFRIYARVGGDTPKTLNKKQFKECAKALAIYHKYVKKFKFKTKREDFNNFDWIQKMYAEMRKVRPKNKTDLLMLRNLAFFEKAVDKLKKIDYGKERTFCHCDWHNDNLLFKRDRLIGIIDFDDITVSPKAEDVANAMVKCRYQCRGYNKEKRKIFLEEYRKIMPFSKKEEKLIISLLLKNACVVFWWFYKGMKKNQDKRHYALQEKIIEAKDYYFDIMGEKGNTNSGKIGKE